MQVGKRELALAQHGAFAWLRLLHLDDQIGIIENVFGSRHDACSNRLVLLVTQSDSGAGVGFHQDRVSFRGQLTCIGGSETYTVLVVLNFSRYADKL